MSDSQASPVTSGNWSTQTINGMQYDVLLPANYDPSVKYPTVLYLHQLDMGNDPSGLVSEVNPWFNSTTFRTDYPAIIVMPLLDQSADPSGQTINWGGVSTSDTTGETNALAALAQVRSQYSTDPSRIYVTGNSMGGIGTEDMMIKFNAYTGTENKIFAAGLSLAGADYGQGYPQPNQSVVTALKNVPFWAIHGGQDTQVPLAWDQNLYAAEQASGGDMIYTQDNSLAHDVWDTYYPQDGSGSPLGWLFSQSTGASVPPPTPTPTPSPNDTVVIAGANAAITDASGNMWTITNGGLVAINGNADTTTANVIELAYVNGTIWQENSSNLWWDETKPYAGWTPAGGTATSPLPAPPAPPTPSPNDTVVMAGANAAITDASGNMWTITNSGLVAINGNADTTTANVIELAYVNGTIWQENSSNLWWDETKPYAGWTPAGGTTTSPLPVPPPPPPVPTPTGTVVGSGSDTILLTMSEDADGPVGAAGRDAEFTLNVDGQQIGGLQTVTASHSAGQTQTFTFQGNFAPGQHVLTVTFANNSMTAGDKAAFNDGGDRNVYVNSVTYDGASVSSTTTPIYVSAFYPPLSTSGFYPGNAVFTATDTTTVPANAPSTPTTTPAGVQMGTGPDTLTLAMSEDPYMGDAQFTVSVDGQQVGGTLTTSAISWEGQTQQFKLNGSWGNGPHTVAVTFLNDLIGPPDAAGGYDPVDRNLYINAINYDGAAASGTPWGLFNNGTQSFYVPATSALPPTPSTASPNDTMVLAGSGSTITDTSSNTWTITGAGQVAVNGVTDLTTASVTELVYVNKVVWQENSSALWWSKTSPAAFWAPNAGTATSPLPMPITIAKTATSATVSQSEISVVATAGSHKLFISGTGDIANLSGGTNTITDTGGGNTYILPIAGKGIDKFTSNILTSKDMLDLHSALAATNWSRSSDTLASYLTVADSAKGAIISVSATAGGTRSVIATIAGATTATLSDLLAHSFT